MAYVRFVRHVNHGFLNLMEVQNWVSGAPNLGLFLMTGFLITGYARKPLFACGA